MSVPSSKRATTWEKPNFETERTSLRPFNPPIAYSTGKVMSRSVSSGESSGATVLIWTWTGVVSGKASSGSFWAERTPTTTRRRESKRTTKRFLRLKSMRAFNMGGAPSGGLVATPGPDGALHDFGLEEVRAVGHHHLAGLESPTHLERLAAADGPRLDSLGPVDAGLLGQEHEVRVLVLLDGSLCDREGRVGLPHLDSSLAKLVGPELPGGVRELGTDLRRPGRLVHLRADPRHLALEGGGRLIGPSSHDGEGHLLARLDLRHVSLVDVNPEPDGRGVGHGVELRCGLDGLAEHGVAEDDRAAERRRDVEEGPRVVVFQDAGKVRVVESEVSEPLLGVQEGCLSLIHGRPVGDDLLGGDGLRGPEGTGASVGVFGQVVGRVGRDVLGLGVAHLGRVNDGHHLVALRLLAQVKAGFPKEARDSRVNLGVPIGVVVGLGV